MFYFDILSEEIHNTSGQASAPYIVLRSKTKEQAKGNKSNNKCKRLRPFS